VNIVQMGAIKIEQLVQSSFDKIFNNFEPIISIMFLCVIIYLKNSPNRDYFAHFFDSNISGSQNTELIDKCNSKLSEMSRQTLINFRNILSQIIRNSVSSN
jgi:hypothetical protein